MLNTLLYTLELLSLVAIGIFVGAKVIPKEKEMKWTGKLQSVSVVFLIFVLGIKIGADPEVFGSIGDIGISALAITAAGMAGAVFFMHFACKMLGFNKEGERKDD